MTSRLSDVFALLGESPVTGAAGLQPRYGVRYVSSVGHGSGGERMGIRYAGDESTERFTCFSGRGGRDDGVGGLLRIGFRLLYISDRG